MGDAAEYADSQGELEEEEVLGKKEALRPVRDRVILFDTETTGTEEGAEIIESAVGFLSRDPDASGLDPFLDRVVVSRFKPSVPIELGAMAVHHIIEEDVADCAPSSTFALPADVGVLVGHSVDFDWKMAGRPRVRRICTLALARMVWPSLDAHTLGAIIYSLFPHPKAQALLLGVHSAAVDVENLYRVLAEICANLKPASWADLWRMSEEARVPKVITFGKHKAPPGSPPTRIEDLPRDYCDWILRQHDMDPYLKVAVRRSLGLPWTMPTDDSL